MRARLAVALLAIASASGQSFEAATVRAAAAGQSRGRGRVTADRLTFRSVNLLYALTQAYGLVSPDQVAGPDWILTERHDIVAKAPDNTPRDQMLVMLQNLLIERFKLVVHKETRELPGYALVTGKGRLKLTEVKDPPVKNDWAVNGEQREARGMTMSALAGFLYPMMQMPVVDQTGLTGFYNFPFAPTREETRREEFPTADTALDELGLRLDSRKLPLDVIVIESGNKVPIDN